MGNKTQKPQKVDLRALYNRSYAGQYVTSVEIDRPLTVRIASLTTETVESWQKGSKPKECLIMHFEGKDRGIVINKTNFKRLADLFGWDTDDWVGQEVTIETAKVKAFGRIIDSIEIRKPNAGNEERIETEEVEG